MSIFLGIGAGPIQTGIFLSGAYKSNRFSEIVIAEVDEEIVNAIRESDGQITINIATTHSIEKEIIKGIKILNPNNSEDKKSLMEIASQADEIATALPSVKIFPIIAKWLKPALEQNSENKRFIYTAENNNHAAELLQESINTNLPNSFFLNTVIGKMSGVVSGDELKDRNLSPLCPNLSRAHLVEEFNKILISNAPGIEKRKVQGLYVKQNLYPFEEAKLYGHNAIHFLLGMLGEESGEIYMNDIRKHPELMDFARKAFIEESGEALCKKYKGLDVLFTREGFAEYAEDLLQRMTNPYLHDKVERIIRDPLRKLGWDDRVVGTMRMVISEGIQPIRLAKGGYLAVTKLFGTNPEIIKKELSEIWPKPWTDIHEKLYNYIISQAH
ncbi:MAG: hypothetical protein D6707_10245 [Bacteroidetes bacterium]|nr:MAG: hypothetical protein D6707_10245 [Bacteroidota bacterium]